MHTSIHPTLRMYWRSNYFGICCNCLFILFLEKEYYKQSFSSIWSCSSYLKLFHEINDTHYICCFWLVPMTKWKKEKRSWNICGYLSSVQFVSLALAHQFHLSIRMLFKYFSIFAKKNLMFLIKHYYSESMELKRC